MIAQELEMRLYKIRPSFMVYLNNLTLSPRDGKIAEVGVSLGLNAQTMLKKCEQQKFVLVDNYKHYVEEPNAEAIAMERLLPYRDRIQFLKIDSVKAASLFRDETFDYVYIDASHMYDDVRKDIEAWYPKVKKMGILAGHDFCTEGVYKATLEFADKINKVVYGVGAYTSVDAINASNLALMCDWWLYK